MSDAMLPELTGLSEAEEFFDALGVAYDPKVLGARRLHVMKVFGLAAEAWLAANAGVGLAERRRSIASALRQAHDVFAEEDRGGGRANPFAPGLVQLRRRR